MEKSTKIDIGWNSSPEAARVIVAKVFQLGKVGSLTNGKGSRTAIQVDAGGMGELILEDTGIGRINLACLQNRARSTRTYGEPQKVITMKYKSRL